MARVVLGVDIGGTKVAFGLVDETGRVLSRGRLPTPPSPHEGVRRLTAAVADLCGALGLSPRAVVACGVGCCGPLDPAGGRILNPPNLPGWHGFPLAHALATAWGHPVFLDNDANVAAVGEHRYGAGRGVDNLVYFTLSTGVGGGIVLGGELYTGQNGNAGELGHMTVAYDGRPCRCGARGCLEAYASGTALAERAADRAREATRRGVATVLADRPGGPEAISSVDVVAAVRVGDAVAVALWEETMAILGAGVANAIHAFNPGRVVLGGGLTGAGELLLAPVRREALARVMAPLAAVVDIQPAALGEDVGLLGAAALAWARA